MLPIDKEFTPLYSQIKKTIISKINNKEWLPGDNIPSEMQLSQDFKVSHGTVRKAITELVNNNILVRKQGKGTFVTNHDVHRDLFYFFHIVKNDGLKVTPNSKILSCHKRQATGFETLNLQLERKAVVICIKRLRLFKEKPTLIEDIILDANLFSGLGENGKCDLPNTLYEVYENKFKITIYSAKEKLRTVAASDYEAELLGINPNSPLLEIERLALTLNKKPVELRISRCNTQDCYYENTIF